MGTPVSRWLCDLCLALLSLGPFPLLGTKPLTPQREAPLRESHGHGEGADCMWGEQVTGIGAWAWGLGSLVVFVLGTVFEDAGELHI